MWEAAGAVVAVLVAIGGLITWVLNSLEKREQKTRDREKEHADELRMEEVAAWAAAAISAAQNLVVALQLRPEQIDQTDRRALIRDAVFSTSTLVERGRMFFKNCVIDDFGADKEPAYRGYRPKVLDPLVVLYQVGCRYLAEGASPDVRLVRVAENATRQLVSLLQAEVGRSRAASADTSSSGEGPNLDYLLSQLPEAQIARACPGPERAQRHSVG